MTGTDELADKVARSGLDIELVKQKLRAQRIETPSWGYGDSGTRFRTFPWPGAARTVHEKIADAGYVHRLTGIAPTVALHIPWDRTDDWDGLRQYAAEHDVELGAINPNLFQDNAYKLGSLCHPDPEVRKQALEHIVECCQIMEKTGSDVLSLWLADGTNYPGQDDLRNRSARLEEGLSAAYSHLPSGSRMLIEYKFFEPAFYHTDLPDWGSAYAQCLKLGDQAQVLVDTGHHPQGTNLPYIVSFLLSERKLGGFHFNDRRYADDDLIVGSEHPFELFLIFVELVRAGGDAQNVAYMIDQSHNIEPKLEAMIQSVVNCQVAYAKSLLVDFEGLAAAQQDGDVLRAHRFVVDAFNTDVRPMLEAVREEMGRPADPIAAYRQDDYAERVARERGMGSASGGYPT